MGVKGVWILQTGLYEGTETYQRGLCVSHMLHFANMRKIICEFWKNLKNVSKENYTLLVIILTTIRLHTIFYACTSLLDKYCEKEMCNYKCRKF